MTISITGRVFSITPKQSKKTIMVKHKILLLLIFVGSFLQGDLYGQLFVNNGGVVVVKSNAIVSINGSVENKTSSTFTNDGNCYILSDITNNAVLNDNGLIDIKGNWYNNATFNAGTGSVKLSGANQTLGGTISSSFNNLELLGTGIKTQAINQTVTGILSLNDRELATEGFVMNVNNPSVSAITRTTGFVSSTGNGKLSRQTNANSVYLFPVGSSLGTQRYRPIEITPNNASANTYQVRLANVDANTEGYPRAQLETGLCMLNPLFYHRVGQTSGTSSADIRIYFNQTDDGAWQLLSNWNTTPNQRWVDMSPVTETGGTLSSITKNSWSGFANEPIILANSDIYPQINAVPPMCSNDSPINLSANINGGTWSGNGITDPTLGTFNPLVAGGGNHLITYAFTDGCSAQDTMIIIVNAAPSVSVLVTNESCFLANDGSAVASAIGGNPPYNYAWSNTTSSTDNITELVPDNYSVTVTDSKGCSDNANFVITRSIIDCNNDIHSIFVPNIFYPRSVVEENRVVKVYGNGIKSMQFAIYDRWGAKVFATNNQEDSWDGTVNGKVENSAVFVYYLDLVFTSGETHTQKGNITLIR